MLAHALGVPTTISLHASEPPNPWEGYKRCLADLPDRGHLLIVQDDVRVSRGFAEALEKVAGEVPTALFLARLPVRISRMALRATKRGERYVTARLAINEFCPVVAVLWPVEKALQFRTWTEENPHKLGHPRPRSDDGVLGRWSALTRQDIRFTVPSLVEHPDQEPSLIGRKAHWGRDKGRVAQWFAEDASEFEW